MLKLDSLFCHQHIDLSCAFRLIVGYFFTSCLDLLKYSKNLMVKLLPALFPITALKAADVAAVLYIQVTYSNISLLRLHLSYIQEPSSPSPVSIAFCVVQVHSPESVGCKCQLGYLSSPPILGSNECVLFVANGCILISENNRVNVTSKSRFADTAYDNCQIVESHHQLLASFHFSS